MHSFAPLEFGRRGMDRGYPGAALFSGLQSKSIHFIVRMKQHWLPVNEFMASRKRDTTLTLTVPDKYYESYRISSLQ